MFCERRELIVGNGVRSSILLIYLLDELIVLLELLKSESELFLSSIGEPIGVHMLRELCDHIVVISSKES